MFFGEFTCLGVYFLKTALCSKKSKSEDDEELVTPASPGTKMAEKANLKKSVNPLLLAIPATFDFCGSTIMFIGLTMTAASIYQMMRGAIVLITSAMAWLFLGQKQYAHKLISLVIIVLGVAIVGVASQTQTGQENETKPLGLILILIAQLFTGCQFIAEEKILGDAYVDPILVVGLEGTWGFLYYLILLPIFQQVPCDNPNLCVPPNIEDSMQAFRDMNSHPFIWGMAIGTVISIAAFNSLGVSITKYASAAQRATVDSSRTLFIWIFQMMMGKEDFSWL